MSVYKGSQKIKDIYFGAGKTNCLTSVPKNVNLELDKLNVTVTGSPTITNGVVSGFSASNYLKLPNIFNPSSASNWEMVFKFKITSANDGWVNIFGNGDSTDRTSGVHIFYDSNNKIRLECCTSGASSWNICNLTGTTLMELNTDYWVKVEFTGSAYNCYLSTDGSTFNLETSSSSTTKIGATVTQCIGNSLSHSAKYHLGSIDLSQSYIKTNGSIWWQGGTGSLTLKAGSKVYIPNGWSQYKYYKCTTTSWTQPTLSANGTVGGTSYACRSKASLTDYPTYKAFDSDKTSTFWASSTASIGNWIEFYSPVELIVSKIAITNRKESMSDTFGVGIVQGSMDGTNYYDLKTFKNTTATPSATWNITIEKRRPAKNIRILCSTRAGTNGDIVIANMAITAQQVTATVESTADDYDYMVGSGERIFEEVTVENDVSTTIQSAETRLIFMNQQGIGATTAPLNRIFSGDSSPAGQTTMLWYNTEENVIRRTQDSGETWQDTLYSLPIGRATASTTSGFDSIDQHFSWFGFIGSTAFTLPNIEGLCSDGFNTDGTYKNVRGYEDEVQIHTYNTNWTRAKQPIFLQNGSIDFTNVTNDGYHEGTDRSAYDSLTYQCFHNTRENKTYRSGSTAGQWEQQYRTLLGYINMTSGVISSITHIGAKTNNTARKIGRIYKGSTLVYGYAPNKVLFEKNTAGTSTLNIEYSGYYDITVVGAGSGGAFEYSAKFADGAAAGGSGGGFNGIAYLQAGSYSITVGAGGAGAWDNNSREYISASAGGASKFGSIVTANGGTAPTARYNNGSQTAGQGGTVSYTASAFKNVLLNKQGNAGATATNASTSSTYAGGASVYGGYGAGGQAKHGGAYAGGNGYVKVVVYS